jgi:amino acid transporter
MLLVGLGAIYQGFSTLVDYTAPVFWLFMAASGLAVIVLRLEERNVERPFRTPLYPLTPLAFASVSLAMAWSSLVYVKAGALFGVGVLLAGGLVLAALAGIERRKTS